MTQVTPRGVTTLDARRDGLLPMDVIGVAEAFGDELTLLGALQLRWHTRLAGRIEHYTEHPLDGSMAHATAIAARKERALLLGRLDTRWGTLVA